MTIKTDAVIVGAGPCGLFQVFELGLLGLKAAVVDSLPAAGGQCIELYPDKPIYDIPAIPVISGEELIAQLLEQIEPFGASMHLGEEVTEVHGDGNGPFRVVTAAGTEFETSTVFVAGGVGSFQPRKLRTPGIEQFEEDQLFYRVRKPERFADRNLVIMGGGDSALDWVLALAPAARSVTLVHRSDTFRAAPASVAKMRELEATGHVRCIEFGTLADFQADNDRLVEVTIKIKPEGQETLPLDDLLVFYGLAPKLGPIAEWGLDLNRKTINVDTEKFQTNVPGIYAIGDINAYPGKKKLILSGFHEAALAAFAAKQHIEPGRKVHLQYTTTSPVMHERLGVEGDT